MKTKNTPAKAQLSIFRQICQLIPGYLVPELARKVGIEKRCRTFSPWSHVCAMVYGQVAHSQSLNDLCDALDLEAPALHAIRGAGKKMPVNLVLVAEGEEEIGSPHIGQLVNRAEVAAALRNTVGVFMPAASQDLDGVVTVSTSPFP